MSLQARAATRGLKTLTTLTALTYLATAVACGGGAAPELEGLADQVAQVGTELKLDLNGTDPDGDQLSYGFKAADLMDLGNRTSVSVSPSGSGVFRWTPVASDVGQHSFDFTVTDGSNTTTTTISIDVRSAIGSATAPVFRQPLGTGTTVDLTQSTCVDLSIVIEDQDTTQVTLSQVEPVIAGALLTQTDGQTATWHWCPTHDQEAESRYTLTLGADDGDNPMTLKTYLVVLRGGSNGSTCPGTAPVISHTPQNETTVSDLTIDATVTDDLGLKDSPLFYYSLTAPANPPVLAAMTQLSTLQITGSSTNGQYAADVPNPVAGLPAGTAKTLYYVFVADDDDDTTGSCDHTTVSPVYRATITSSGVADQGICTTCSSDSQCGTGDLCVYIGSMGSSYCLQDCGAGCPTGYGCSSQELYSVDGGLARQCVPSSGSCVAPTAMCVDDANEEDDSRTKAMANATARGPLTATTHDFVMCPNASATSVSASDDDWFQIKATADTRADISLVGNGESDLDLHVYKSDGTLFTQSTSLRADEEVVKCLPVGTYYVKVNGWDRIRSEYLLDYTATPQSCTTTCVDDSYEDDDTYSTARSAFSGYLSTGNVSCPNDDDYFQITLFAGKTLTMDLTFAQSSSTGDLDLHLFEGFTDLWPCSAANPAQCTAAHGQGAVSNEHATFTAPASCTNGCDYDVVVRGYNGSTNTYGLKLTVQ